MVQLMLFITVLCSAEYWNTSKLSILSMIKAKGPMTFFLTLLANDMDLDRLMIVLCIQQIQKPATYRPIQQYVSSLC